MRRRLGFALIFALAACAPPIPMPPPVQQTTRPNAAIMWGEAKAKDAAEQLATLIQWDTACDGEFVAHERMKLKGVDFFGDAFNQAVTKIGEQPRDDVLANTPEFCRPVARYVEAVLSVLLNNRGNFDSLPTVDAIEGVRITGIALGNATRCPGGTALRPAFIYSAQRDAINHGMVSSPMMIGIMATYSAKAQQHQPTAKECEVSLNLIRAMIRAYPPPPPPPPYRAPAAPPPSAGEKLPARPAPDSPGEFPTSPKLLDI